MSYYEPVVIPTISLSVLNRTGGGLFQTSGDKVYCVVVKAQLQNLSEYVSDQEHVRLLYQKAHGESIKMFSVSTLYCVDSHQGISL